MRRSFIFLSLVLLSLPVLAASPSFSPAGEECLVEVKFGQPEGRIRLRLGVTLHHGWAEATKSASVRESLRALKLEHVRLPTGTELGPFAGPVPGLMDVSNLLETAKFTLSIGARPLVCVRMQPSWSLSPEEFASFCWSLAKALKTRGLTKVSFEIFEAPDLGPMQLAPKEMARYVGAASGAIKAVLPGAEVGGPGLSAPWRKEVEEFFSKCGKLDFFSFHFFGTHNASTPSDRLFRAAVEAVAADLPDQLTPGEVRATMVASGHPEAKMFVTRLNLNSIRTPEGGPRDIRVSSAYCAAWLAAFLASVSRDVDCAFYYDALHPGWGLLRGEVKAPAYHALWLFSTFFPRGATVCSCSSAGRGFCFSARTRTAGNVLLVNPLQVPLRFTVAAFGLKSPLRMCRARIYRASQGRILFVPLPVRLVQRLILGPRDVAVVQFVPRRW